MNNLTSLELEIKEIADNLGENNLQFDGKCVLLAGSGGFIGQNLKLYFLYLNKYILKNPVKVICVDCYVGRDKPKEIEDPNLVHIDHDLTTHFGLKLIDYPIGLIINCSGRAAPSGPSGYEHYPIEVMDVGYLGTKYLNELALQNKAKIVHFSSSEVLSKSNELPYTEETHPCIHTQNKRAPYDSIKILQESQNWAYRNKYGLDTKVIRLFNTVGFFDSRDKRVVSQFMQQAINNQKIKVFAPGTQERTLSYFTDVLTGIILVLLNGKDLLYHIASDDEPVSMIDLAYKIENVCGKSGLVEIIPTPEVYKHEPQKRQSSVEKARKELGYNPKVKIDEMLERIYNWAKENYKA